MDFFGSCVFFREQTSLRSLIHFGLCGAVGDGARAANSCRWDGHRCGPRGRPAATGGGFSRWIFLGRLELQILIYLEGREKSTTKNPPRPKTVEKKSTATKNTTQNTPTFRFLVAAQLEAFHSYACERCGAHQRTYSGNPRVKKKTDLKIHRFLGQGLPPLTYGFRTIDVTSYSLRMSRDSSL